MTSSGERSAARAGAAIDRLARVDVRQRRDAADRYSAVDAARLAFEEEWGASHLDPDDLSWRALRAEIAAALTIHEQTAGILLENSRRLVHDFSATLAALRAGAFPDSHARILVEKATGLSPELFGEYQERLLEVAPHLVAGRFAKYAAEVRAALAPETLIERHREALHDRRVAVEAAPDGMAWYGAYLSAEDAVGAAAAVTGLARGLKADGDERTLAQIQADVFRDLLVDAAGVVAPAEAGSAPVASPAARRGVRAEVLIHVPVLTAMGTSHDAALLDGYGPIDADTARQLCAEAPGFLRLLTDPADGATLSFGRTTYRPRRS